MLADRLTKNKSLQSQAHNPSIHANNWIDDDHKDSYTIEIATPELEKSTFKINVNGRLLTITAGYEKIEEPYNYPSFARSFILSEEFRQADMDTTYDMCTLTLKIPKPGRQLRKPKRSPHS